LMLNRHEVHCTHYTISTIALTFIAMKQDMNFKPTK
jgi:hypothetical protein